MIFVNTHLIHAQKKLLLTFSVVPFVALDIRGEEVEGSELRYLSSLCTMIYIHGSFFFWLDCPFHTGLARLMH